MPALPAAVLGVRHHEIMSNHKIVRVFPNEKSQLILEFSDFEYRIFDLMILYEEMKWKELAYPQHQKKFVASASEILWPNNGKVNSNFLYEKSKPIERAKLENQVIRLSYKNQAPTSEDKFHHVYGVYLAPYSSKPFRVGESIGGGMADRGGGFDYSLNELINWPEWKWHFELSGCKWATKLVDSLAGNPAKLIEALIAEACSRNGSPENA